MSLDKLASSAPLAQQETLDPHVAEVEYRGMYKTTVHKTVSVPSSLHGFALLQCLIRFLQVKTAEQFYSLYKYVTAVQGFINFLSARYKSSKSIPNTILQSYALHLSEEEKQVPSSIRTNMGLFSMMLQWCIDKPWFQTSPECDRVFILTVYAKKPSIPTNSMLDGTAPAMSELVEGKEFDDRDLLDSLIRFCFGFLSIFKKHREQIISNRGVKARLELAQATNNADIDWHFLRPNWDDYNEIFNAIVDSRDATLVERLLLSNQRFQDIFTSADEPDTLNELYLKLKTCIRGIGSLCFTDRLSDNSQYVTFEQLDIRSLLSPCEAEEICLRWLLGIDRIQHSGQQKLTLQDIELTPTHMTIEFLKRRSNEYQRESTSHKRRTYNYKLISYVLKLRQDFEQIFGQPDTGEQFFFQYDNPFARRQHHSSITYRPIIFACTPGNNLYEEIGSMFPRAKLFQEYFRLLVDENTAAHAESDSLQKSKNGEIFDKNEPLTRRLTASVIAQSRAIIDPEEPPIASSFDRRSKAEAAADGAAHSIRTSQEVYKNRSQTVHRLGQRAKFVATVGKLQEEDARRLSSLMNSTKVISLDNVNVLLGWDVSSFKPGDIDEFNKLINSAEQSGYNCAPFGWLSTPSSLERIVLVTPVTAALILSFIKGCQSELKDSVSLARSHAIILQLCYAKMVLNSFDRRTVADAREMLLQYDFPPAII